MTWTRTRAGLAIVGASIIAGLVMAGCATAAHDPDYDGESVPQIEKDASLCLKSGPCVVLQVTSNNLQDSKLYLNGSRFAYVNSLSDATVFIPRWRLDNGGCAVITVILQISGTRASTQKECVRDKDYLTLEINDSNSMTQLHIWLVPRRSK